MSVTFDRELKLIDAVGSSENPFCLRPFAGGKSFHSIPFERLSLPRGAYRSYERLNETGISRDNVGASLALQKNSNKLLMTMLSQKYSAGQKASSSCFPRRRFQATKRLQGKRHQ
jgi:hypothetical protein